MKLFLHAHANHPDARVALARAATQIEAQRAGAQTVQTPTLGWLYLTDHYADQAEVLLADVRARWPGVAWIGAVGVGIAANGVEYFNEPALALMLGDTRVEHFQVFSGARPLGAFAAATAQIHADPATPELTELIAEMAARTSTGYLFGGLSSARSRSLHIADGVFEGGLSGVAFTDEVAIVSRVTQGCQPVGPMRTITQADYNVVMALDGESALDCLLRDVGLTSLEPRAALPRLRETLVGLSERRDDASVRPGALGLDTRVRNLVGLDPARRGVAIGDAAVVGTQLAFCRRNATAARLDLVRICSEIREELEPDSQPLATALALRGSNAEQLPHAARGIAGAVYVSCAGRGGPHFGAPSAELALVRQALGNVPLVGFFASGEIARHHLYGYTGVLTAFTG